MDRALNEVAVLRGTILRHRFASEVVLTRILGSLDVKSRGNAKDAALLGFQDGLPMQRSAALL